MLDEIKNLLLSIKGVVAVEEILLHDAGGGGKKIKADLSCFERESKKNQLVKLVNSGLVEVLARDVVFLILKDKTFRNPPSPTVVMVEELLNNDDRRDYIRNFDGIKYRVIGEEIFGGEDISENHMFISSGFVMYPDRRSGRENIPSWFLMPGIRFPELEEVKERFGIENIVSASPSAKSDDYLRKLHNMSIDNQLATILVGFDKIRVF